MTKGKKKRKEKKKKNPMKKIKKQQQLNFPKISIRMKNHQNINLIMNYDKLYEKCEIIMKALKNNDRITSNISWNWTHKSFFNLLYEIAFNCIILSDSFSMFLPKFINKNMNKKQECIYVSNRIFFLKLLFQNKRVVFLLMNNNEKWKCFFASFNDLMNSKQIGSEEYTELARVLMRTFFYWKYEHICFLDIIKFRKSISTALFYGYCTTKTQSSKLRLAIDFMVKILTIIKKDQSAPKYKYDTDLKIICKDLRQLIIPKKKKKKKNGLQ